MHVIKDVTVLAKTRLSEYQRCISISGSAPARR